MAITTFFPDLNDKGVLKKKFRDYLGSFTKMGGGGLPNSQNQKKVPLNHPKIT